jgi:hypothetical protein
MRTRGRTLRGDLDTLVLKALRKAPARRYASVEALADDLRRYLAGRPLAACPDATTSYPSRFSARSLRHMQAVQRLLLSPPDDEAALTSHLDAVCAAVRTLMRTDHVYYLEPASASGPSTPACGDGAPVGDGALPARLLVHSPSTDDAFARGINDHFVGFTDDGFSLFREAYPTMQHRIVRQAGAGCYHDAPLHDDDARQGLALYQEVFRPADIYRQVVLSLPLTQGEAMLLVGYPHAATDRPAFEGERHRLLQMLVPAFEANLQARQQARGWGPLAASLDRREEALLVFDADGRERYRNRAARQLAAEPNAAAACIERAARELVRALRQGTDACNASWPDVVGPAGTTYVLRGRYEATLLGDPGIVVSVVRTHDLPASAQGHRS